MQIEVYPRVAPGREHHASQADVWARYGETVSQQRPIPLDVTLDGRQAISETTWIAAGPYVLVIATTLPEHGLALEIHSIFVGHPGVETSATHLRLGPVGRPPFTIIAEHEHAEINPMTQVRACVYEHAEILLQTLNSLDYEATIDVPDDAFSELERVDARPVSQAAEISRRQS